VVVRDLVDRQRDYLGHPRSLGRGGYHCLLIR
jgi:hypothetical protein